MAYSAVMSLLENRGNRVIAVQDGHIVNMDMEEALQMQKPFDMERYRILQALSRTPTEL